MSDTNIWIDIHVVFSVKDRLPHLDAAWREDLHAYIGGTIRGLHAVPYAVGGTADHVHFLAGLNATHCIADIVREVKKSSSLWCAERHHGFRWQTGYGAFSIGPERRQAVVQYITNQEEHHKVHSSKDEMVALMRKHGVEPNDWFH